MADQPKYTKGPWAVSKLVEGAIVAESDTDTNLLGLDSRAYRTYPVFTNPHDARLAAAAPDLLEALKDAVRWLERLEDAVPDHFQHSAPFGCMELEGMKLAIAKAEGQ